MNFNKNMCIECKNAIKRKPYDKCGGTACLLNHKDVEKQKIIMDNIIKSYEIKKEKWVKQGLCKLDDGTKII